MAMTRAEILKRVADSAASAGGNNLRDGRGRLAIKSLSFNEGFKGSRFTSEFVVVGSQKIHVVEQKTGKALDIEPNAPNTDVSVIQMLDKHASSFGNIKAFVLALFGESEHAVSDEEFIETLDEITSTNSAAGMLIDYETYRKVTQERGIEIVLPKWFRVEQTPEDIAKVRAWMESLYIGQKQAATVPTSAATAAVH